MLLHHRWAFVSVLSSIGMNKHLIYTSQIEILGNLTSRKPKWIDVESQRISFWAAQF
jgi:hypothetical protein